MKWPDNIHELVSDPVQYHDLGGALDDKAVEDYYDVRLSMFMEEDCMLFQEEQMTDLLVSFMSKELRVIFICGLFGETIIPACLSSACYVNLLRCWPPFEEMSNFDRKKFITNAFDKALAASRESGQP